MKGRIAQIGISALIAGILFSIPAAATVRPAIAKALVAARDFAKAGNYKKAIAEITRAAAVRNQTDEETTVIYEMRQYIGLKMGDRVQP
jgi:hypothetical protein